MHLRANIQRYTQTFPYKTHFKRFLLWLMLYLITLTVYRIAFTMVHSYRIEGVSFFEIFVSYLIGFRFDLSASTLLLIVPLLLSLVGPLNRYAIYRHLWSTLPVFIYVLLVCLLTADVIYYENGNKHLGYEAFSFLSNLGLLLSSALVGNTAFFLIGLLVLIIVIPTMLWLQVRHSIPYVHTSAKAIWLAVAFTLVIGIIFIRGGIQPNPLRANDAMISQNDFLNNLGLNPVYTMMVDLRTFQVPEKDRLSLEDSLYLARKEMAYDGAEFVSTEYPLLRKTIAKRPGKPPNIVLILLENWTGKFVSPISDGKVQGVEITPNFNALAREGIFFRRFFANGGRTTSGMMASLAGIPDRPGLTIVRTRQILNNFSGLGSILNQQGYSTLFVTGGPLEFDNKRTVMPHFGYKKVLGVKQIEAMGRTPTGSWGFDDEDILDVLHQEIVKQGEKPFLATALTLSTHYPYSIPDDRFRILKEKTMDTEFLNSYHYADSAVGSFMKKASQSKYFENTVFIFVGDHTHHRHLNYYEDRNVPFLVYWKGKLQAQIREDVASQLDIIPTILGFVGKTFYFTAMGKDLFAPNRTESAYFAHGNIFGWIGHKAFYYQMTDAIAGTARKVGATEYDMPSCFSLDLECEMLQQKARVYLSLSSQLLEANKLYPPDSVNPSSLPKEELPAGCPISKKEHEKQIASKVDNLFEVQRLSMDGLQNSKLVQTRIAQLMEPSADQMKNAESFYNTPIYIRQRDEKKPVPSRHAIQKIHIGSNGVAEVVDMILMEVFESGDVRRKGIMISDSTWKLRGCEWFLEYPTVSNAATPIDKVDKSVLAKPRQP